MRIQDGPYAHSEEEFDEMRELLLNSYAVSTKPFNWRLAMIENWNYASRYLEPWEYFTSRVRLWRNHAGELLSFLIRYYNTTYLQVSPGFRFLEPTMLDWAEAHWSDANHAIHTSAFAYDVQRQELLMQRGYTDAGASAIERLYDLGHTYPEPRLLAGFRVASVAELGDCAGRIALEKAIWNADILDEAWFRGKSSAPNYSLDWDLVVVSPGGQQVAASLVWLDLRNHTAEIDPLGVHPNYRRRGLARALVLESFRRLRTSGVHLVYIASNTANEAANRLYGSLEPKETYYAHHWIRSAGS